MQGVIGTTWGSALSHTKMYRWQLASWELLRGGGWSFALRVTFGSNLCASLCVCRGCFRDSADGQCSRLLFYRSTCCVLYLLLWKPSQQDVLTCELRPQDTMKLHTISVHCVCLMTSFTDADEKLLQIYSGDFEGFETFLFTFNSQLIPHFRYLLFVNWFHHILSLTLGQIIIKIKSRFTLCNFCLPFSE